MLRFLLFPHFSNVTWRKSSNFKYRLDDVAEKYSLPLQNIEFQYFLAGNIVGIADLWSEMHASLRKKMFKNFMRIFIIGYT